MLGSLSSRGSDTTCPSCCSLAETFPGIREPKLVVAGCCGFVCLLLGGRFNVLKQKGEKCYFICLLSSPTPALHKHLTQHLAHNKYLSNVLEYLLIPLWN